jgi:hypothetical protein
MTVNSANQGIPEQQGGDAANLPSAQVSWDGVMENRLAQRYTNEADRTARNGAPNENEISSLAAEDRTEIFNSSAWISLYSRSLFQNVRRTTDAANINNSTALVSDGTLVTTFPAVTGIYQWEDTILYSSSQAGDFKVAYLFTAGTVWWGGIGLATAATATTGDGQWAIQTASDTANAYGGAAVGTKLILKVWGEISLTGTGTNLTLRYAQNSLDATNTVPAYTGTNRKVWRVS